MVDMSYLFITCLNFLGIYSSNECIESDRAIHHWKALKSLSDSDMATTCGLGPAIFYGDERIGKIPYTGRCYNYISM